MDGFTRRIVVLGKTGAGKSSLANTLFGETVFRINHSPISGTSECLSKSTSINGKTIIFTDTPGFFDTGKSEKEMMPEIVRCITDCAPGPHVFLIVLKVEKFTEQEKAVVEKMKQYFSAEALKYSTILFTHGDQLPDGMKIEEFVYQSEDLSDLVRKCGSRCHVVDNKYWKNNQEDDYRSNQYHVAQLLNTIDKIIETNNGGYFTNEMLQGVKRDIDQQEGLIKLSSPHISEEEITKKAKDTVFKNLLVKAAEVTLEALLEAFLSGKNVRLACGVALVTAVAAAAKGIMSDTTRRSGTASAASAEPRGEQNQE